MADFVIKQGDTRKDLERILAIDGSAVDLSDATSVEFHLCNKARKGFVKFNKDATIVDATSGQVKYEWADGDTEDAGTFFYEFQVNWSNGDTQTFPNDGFKSLKIHEEGA